ncbi:recombinase family protein [Novosphingobium beihaiensis]|uniref:Recombinase family protein n=1 Tax=Novosphingobium beihaiensis TaxID=2930389 RepID=A0ABT0BMG0_9SPHN|nr:recombinase family protein [Novosphingobium beihaiensis]MCJ2186236.1 recombinase family protein [Novosphingobium beihaiensis]
MDLVTAAQTSPKRIGYARVSTDSQTLYQYRDLLKAARCDRIFMDDGVSAVAKVRPQLEKARAALRDGDTFIVPAIDRAFRSTIEGITFLDDLHAQGITFESIYQQIDTRTPEGRKWYIDMVNHAEYERAIISRRTKEKMSAAKRKGIHCGRPRKLSECQVRKAHIQATVQGVQLSVLAEHLHVSPRTLLRGFERCGLAE